jgi:hypothetical protein
MCSVFQNNLDRYLNDTFEEVKPFQDYIMHQVIQLAGKYDIPFQFHTGLQSGDGNFIDNANPSHMANLFLQYRGCQICFVSRRFSLWRNFVNAGQEFPERVHRYVLDCRHFFLMQLTLPPRMAENNSCK